MRLGHIPKHGNGKGSIPSLGTPVHSALLGNENTMAELLNIRITSTMAILDCSSGRYSGSKETFDALSFNEANEYMARVWEGYNAPNWNTRVRNMRKMFGNEIARTMVRLMANDGVTGFDSDGHTVYN